MDLIKKIKFVDMRIATDVLSGASSKALIVNRNRPDIKPIEWCEKPKEKRKKKKKERKKEYYQVVDS